MKTLVDIFLCGIFLFIWLIMSGCVVMTTRTFAFYKRAYESIGYMEGTGEGSKHWMTAVEGLEREVAECKDKIAPASAPIVVPSVPTQIFGPYYFKDNMPVQIVPGGQLTAPIGYIAPTETAIPGTQGKTK